MQSSRDPLVSLGSRFTVEYDGGPRPWVREPEKYFTKSKFLLYFSFLVCKIDGILSHSIISVEPEMKSLVSIGQLAPQKFVVDCENKEGNTVSFLLFVVMVMWSVYHF